MANPWYETLTLVLSNFPIVFALLSTGLRKKPRIVDFTFFAMTGAASVIYHFCQSADLCLGESLARLRPADHIFVWTLGFWVLMRILRLNKSIMISLTLLALFMFVIFADYLVATLIFPITVTLFFFTIYILRSTEFHIPLYHFGFFFFLWSLLLITSGLFLFFFAGDIFAPDFWIYHSIWHVLSETGIWLLYEAVTGTRIFSMCGLEWIYDQGYGYVELGFEWEEEVFERRREKRKTLRQGEV